MHGGKYPSAVSIPREGAMHASQSEFCLVFSLIAFQATPAENVWPPCSKSVHSQVSAALWTVAFVWAWICTDDIRASRQQAKGWRCYLSQNIGPAVAGSAGPPPPPLCRLLIQVAKIVWPIFVSFKQVTNTVQYIFNKFYINSQSVTTKVSSINRDTREKGKERGWMKGIGEGRDGG